MNKQAVLKMIDKIRVAYPSRKYYESKEDLKTLVDMWLDLFDIFTEEFMNKALNRALRKSDYPPTFSVIDTSVDELLEEHRRAVSDARDQVKWVENRLLYCQEDEKPMFEESKKLEEERLKRLEEFKIYD